jgi:sulfur-oxidizing protein SoxY
MGVNDATGAKSMLKRAFLPAFRLLCAAGLVAGSASLSLAVEQPDPWPDLVRDAFGGRVMNDGTGLISLEMPARAEDAAIVPVTIRLSLPPTEERTIKSVALVIDRNPAPVAATFELGPNSGVDMIATRVRVDTYTDVHAVAELSDGTLYMTKTYVKASGGCSAPAAKNADEAKAELGRMRFRQFAGAARANAMTSASRSGAREAQLMIRHPNNSGLQMDQVTRLYTPAFFVRDVSVWQGDRLLFKADAGISIAEDPNFRFTYRTSGAGPVRATALDTDGNTFKGEWPAEGAGE